MSFGFGFSDFIKGIELCVKIAENYREEPDVHIRELKQDVYLIPQKLKRLQDEFSKAQALRVDESCTDEDPRVFIQKQTEELVGSDLLTTLQDCEKFVKKYGRLNERKAKVREKITLGGTIQKRASDLRSRIQYQLHKIELTTREVEINLFRHIARIADELRGPPVLVLPDIPKSVVDRFCAALQVNPPDSFIQPDTVPLKEGYDAAFRHYRNSTLQFTNLETGPQSAQQYLNLLKAQWLLGIMKAKSMPPPEANDPDFVYNKAISGLQHRVAAQYARSDLSVPEKERVKRFSEMELVELNDADFAIWPEPHLGDLLETATLEVEILRIGLPKEPGFREKSLTFFQANENSIRIVENRVLSPPFVRQQQIQRTINVHADGFIPWYTLEPTEPTVQITESRGSERTAYDFGCREDALHFQQAVTGYFAFPVGEKVRATLTFVKRSLFIMKMLDQLQGTGCMQIWNCSPLPAKTDSSSHPRPSVTSLWPQSPNSTAETGSSTLINSPTVSVTDTKSMQKVTAPKTTYPPALVAFIVDHEHGTYNIWFIELKSTMVITECREVEPDKFRVVLERKNRNDRSRFSSRILSVPKKSLQDWNLAIFGLPRHPEFDSVAKFSCDYLALDFTSAMQMDDFCRHIEYNIKEWRDRVKAVAEIDAVKRSQSNKPSSNPSNRSHSRHQSLTAQ